MNKYNIGIIQVILSQFIVGFIYIFIKFGLPFGIYNLAFFRVFLAFIFLGLLFLFSRKYSFTIIKYDKGKMILFGFLHALTIILSFISIKNLPLSLAVLLTATISIWMIIFSNILLKEKINFKIVYSILLCFIGLLFVVELDRFSIWNYTLGVVTGLLVGILGGFIYAFSKTLKNYDGISLTFWQNLIATPFLIPLLFIEPIVINPYNSIIVLGLSIFGVSSSVLIYQGFKLIKGQIGGVLSLSNIIFTMFLGFLFFRETLSLYKIAGSILVIYGSYLAIKSQ